MNDEDEDDDDDCGLLPSDLKIISTCLKAKLTDFGLAKAREVPGIWLLNLEFVGLFEKMLTCRN